MKGRTSTKKQTSRNGSKLSDELKRLLERMGSDAPTPDLSIDITLVPGEYWVFQPGWFNLRWWWEEIKTSAELTRSSLLKLQAYYVHECTLRTLVSTMPDFRSPEKLSKHLSEVLNTRSDLTEQVATRLFSLREKLAWIVYEIISSLSSIYLEPWNVSYTRVRKKLDNLTVDADQAAFLLPLKKAMSALNDADNANIREFFNFRHGYVHHIRPQTDAEQPLLLLQKEKHLWDSLPTGAIRTRRVVHLASFMWLRLITAIQEVATASLPACGLNIIAKITKADVFDPLLSLHSGAGFKFEYGEIVIKCMKECRGFLAWFTPSPDLVSLDYETAQGKNCLNRVWEIMKEVIPPFEPEKHRGVLKYQILQNDNDRRHLLLLTEGKAADPLSESVVEQSRKRAMMDIARSGVSIDFSEMERLLLELEETKTWPEEARKGFMNTLRKVPVYGVPVTRQNPEGGLVAHHVIFRGLSRGEPTVEEAAEFEQIVLLNQEVKVSSVDPVESVRN
jgi:hypothetical protein